MRSRTLAAASSIIVLSVLGAVLISRSNRQVSGPLPQRGYLWQRDWTPAVTEAVKQAQSRLTGIVILGGEIAWEHKQPVFVPAAVDWETLRTSGVRCAVGLRIAPCDRSCLRDELALQFVTRVAGSLVKEAASHHVLLQEFQLDFDCPENDLAAYRLWVQGVRQSVGAIRFVITALPAWLNEPDFLGLVKQTDGYVLQVHSVAVPNGSGRTDLCDTSSARAWVAKAARLGLPFSVALPTYSCTAGYAPNGKLLGIAMDSVQPAWPQNTRILEFSSSADDIAQLVSEWTAKRPKQLRELIWYRIPVATDFRNWRWTTLAAVMAGRKPVQKLAVSREGKNPVDLSVSNTGENDQELHCSIVATTDGEPVVAADALPGWSVELVGNRALFSIDHTSRVRLSPGDRRAVGWIRCQEPDGLRLAVIETK